MLFISGMIFLAENASNKLNLILVFHFGHLPVHRFNGTGCRQAVCDYDYKLNWTRNGFQVFVDVVKCRRLISLARRFELGHRVVFVISAEIQVLVIPID